MVMWLYVWGAELRGRSKDDEVMGGREHQDRKGDLVVIRVIACINSMTITNEGFF